MLFDKRTTIATDRRNLFNLVVDLENAPHVHPIITKTEQLTSGGIGVGTHWRKYYNILGLHGHFELTLSEYQPYERVVFTGTKFFSIAPKFTIHFRDLPNGTEIHYMINPSIPRFIYPIAKRIFIPMGNRDLAQYFGKLQDIFSTA